MIEIKNIDKTERTATVTLTDDSKHKAAKNENGWAVFGTDVNGNYWERDDFDSLDEAIEDLLVYINEDASMLDEEYPEN